MPQRTFIGRREEVSALKREFERERPSLSIVYGRRRVGKSTLLVHATSDRPVVYFQAARIAASENISLFKEEIGATLGLSAILEGLHDWRGLLTYLAEKTHAEIPGLTVVIDEFPYLCESDPGLPSVIQKFWDESRRDDSKLKLVLCGSTVSFMEELLAEKNPLHGRQTFELDLGPLPLREAAEFFPAYSPEDLVYTYGVFGGIPYYLELCDPDGSFARNVVDLILAKGAPLLDEPNHVLQAELTTITRYATIMRSIAAGCTTTGSIIGRVSELTDASQLAPYVRKLSALRLIRIVRSLDASKRERDRRYYLDDPFLAFWYHFCLPNLSALESGHSEEVWRERIRPNLDLYMGELFQWICRHYVRRHVQEVTGSPAADVGQIWSNDFDIDVAGTLLNGETIFGECKWWTGTVGINILDGLKQSAARTSYGRTDRRYLIFARRAFTPTLQRRAEEEHRLHLLRPADLLRT